MAEIVLTLPAEYVIIRLFVQEREGFHMKKELLVPLASGILSICLSLTACGGSPSGAATPSPSPSAVPTEESTPTPTATLTPTLAPTETPSPPTEMPEATPVSDVAPTSSEETFSMEDAALLMQLAVDGWDYRNVTYDETSITVNVSMERLDRYTLYFALDEENWPQEAETVKEIWLSLKSSLLELANSERMIAERLGYSDIHIIIQFLDSDHETPLLIITDGAITYDILAE